MFRSLAFKIGHTALVFAASLLVSKLILPANFGVLSLLILNAALLSLLTGMGADTLILHMLAKGKWTAGQARYFAVRTLLLQLGIFGVGEALFYAVFGKAMLSNEAGGFFLLFDAVYFTGLVAMEKFVALLYGLHRATAANRILFWIAAGFLLLFLAIAVMPDISVAWVMLAFAIHTALAGLALWLLTTGMSFAVSPGDRVALTPHLRWSSLVMVTNLLQLLAYRVDFWLIKYFYDTEAVGQYAQANKFAQLMWMLPNMATQLLIPRFSAMEKRSIGSIFSLGLLTNFLLLVLTTVLATIIFRVYLFPEYTAALPAFYLMLPGYFFWAMVIYIAGYFSWQGKFNYNFWGSAACLVIISLADLVLIPRWGIQGGAVANSIAYSAIFVLYLVLLHRQNDFSLRMLFGIRRKDLLLTLQLLRS